MLSTEQNTTKQYDAQIGRWHSIDKLVELDFSSSGYAYVGGNPVSLTDYLGLTYTYDWVHNVYINDDGEVVGWDEVYDWVKEGIELGVFQGGTMNFADGFEEVFELMFGHAKTVYSKITDAGITFYTYDDYSDGNAGGMFVAFWDVISFEEKHQNNFSKWLDNHQDAISTTNLVMTAGGFIEKMAEQSPTYRSSNPLYYTKADAIGLSKVARGARVVSIVGFAVSVFGDAVRIYEDPGKPSNYAHLVVDGIIFGSSRAGEFGLVISFGLVIADNTGLLDPMYEGLDNWLCNSCKLKNSNR